MLSIAPATPPFAERESHRSAIAPSFFSVATGTTGLSSSIAVMVLPRKPYDTIEE